MTWLTFAEKISGDYLFIVAGGWKRVERLSSSQGELSSSWQGVVITVFMFKCS